MDNDRANTYYLKLMTQTEYFLNDE